MPSKHKTLLRVTLPEPQNDSAFLLLLPERELCGFLSSPKCLNGSRTETASKLTAFDYKMRSLTMPSDRECVRVV